MDDIDIAAFLTPELLLSASPRGYDLILIHGAFTADFQEAERLLDTKIRLGPENAADLRTVLRPRAPGRALDKSSFLSTPAALKPSGPDCLQMLSTL